jgi:hypothetical protein
MVMTMASTITTIVPETPIIVRLSTGEEAPGPGSPVGKRCGKFARYQHCAHVDSSVRYAKVGSWSREHADARAVVKRKCLTVVEK